MCIDAVKLSDEPKGSYVLATRRDVAVAAAAAAAQELLIRDLRQ